MAIVSGYASASIDCPDPAALLDFYQKLTGWKTVFVSEEFSAISPDGGPVNGLGFQRVEHYRAPEWPGHERPQQFHLDFYAPDLDKAQQEAVGIGARLASVQPQPDRWRVLLDPAGHPFCLCVEP
jgi:catechol 2,3-dioxygenase-like lactoylglutathione lyase family enzyme